MLRSPEPTAEQVVQAMEAAFLRGEQAELATTARFMNLDVAVEHQRRQVEHALLAAEMLGLATPRSRKRRGYDFSPLASLIVNGRNEDKRVLFKVHLEQYAPFILFVECLRAGVRPRQAALQVCAVHDFADDPVVAWRAFESWGTYSGSMVRADDGRYVPSDPTRGLDSLRQTIDVLCDRQQDARQFVLDYLGEEAFNFSDGRVREALADVMVMLANDSEPGNIILLLSNTYEDFLRLVGYRRVNLQNASGIIQIGNQLRGRGLIAQKHLGAIQLVGHIRNAAEHGGDPDEENRPWEVSLAAIRLMILAALSSIRSIVLYRERRTLEL